MTAGASVARPRLFQMRTRWLVLSMVVAVIAVGALGYWNERGRSDAELADFAGEQASVAEAAALALGPSPDLATARRVLAPLEQAGHVRVLVAGPGSALHTLDGGTPELPSLADAIARGDHVFVMDRARAPVLGLPERLAAVGLAPVGATGWTVAIAKTAERARDRDRAGLQRLMLSIVLATGIVAAFGGLALARQRSQLELARELAVTDTARARDAELERLSRAATMAALGSGVAHELSTPLGVIVGRAEQLASRANGDERVAKNAQTIIDQADHIDRVVRGLLGLARGAPIALAPIAPRSLVDEAAELVAHRFARADVHLVPDVGSDLPEVRCEPLLFKHALVNLMLNACDASPRGATVRLEVHGDAQEIAFVVSDEGHGIDPAAAARATEPFFTTKPADKGTGLGLAIAKEIASTHRGTLKLESQKPRGTRATITIPVERHA
jgi:two-component system, NtrC family, sensor kinase